MKKHVNVKSVSKTNYTSNKWLDAADGVDMSQDRVYKHQAVIFKELYTTRQSYTSKNKWGQILWHVIQFWTWGYELSELCTCNYQNDITCEEVIWYNKLKLEIDNDGIHTNEYLYGNTGFHGTLLQPSYCPMLKIDRRKTW